MYNNETRDRVRDKQDRILELAERLHLDDYLQLSDAFPGSPRIRQLHGIIFPEWEAAIDEALRSLEMRTTPAPSAPLAAPTCVYCGQPVAVGFNALCEQHLAMCIPCVESHARDEAPHVGCVQVDCYCFDCHAPDPQTPAAREAAQRADETTWRCAHCGRMVATWGDQPCPECHALRDCPGTGEAQRADEAELQAGLLATLPPMAGGSEDGGGPSHRQAHSYVLTDAYTGLPRYCRVVERIGTRHTLSCGHQTQSPSTLYHPGAPMPCLPCTQAYKALAARGLPPMAGGSEEDDEADHYYCPNPIRTCPCPCHTTAWTGTPNRHHCPREGTPEGDAARWLANRGLPPMAGGAPSHYDDPAWYADEAWHLQEERNAESAQEAAEAEHTHFCPTCHQARPCTGTGCAAGPRECATCSQCRGW